MLQILFCVNLPGWIAVVSTRHAGKLPDLMMYIDLSLVHYKFES